MSGSDVEKGAGVHSLQQPRATHSHPHDGFLPSYQEHLNEELRNFPAVASQANLQPFDRVQEPSRKSKASLRRRTWWSAISVLLFLVVSALIGSAVFLYHSTHLKDDGDKVSAPISSFQTITLSSKLTITKEAPQTSMPMSARSATTVTIYSTTVVVTVPATSTVYVTVAPTSQAPASHTFTSTRIITVRPSSSTSTTSSEDVDSFSTPSSTADLDSFSTPSSTADLDSFSIPSSTADLDPFTIPSSTADLEPFTTPSSAEEEEASTVPFSTESSSSSSSTTSSTQATSSSESAPPAPPPSTIATTLVSVTTATATSTTSSTFPPPTVTPRPLGFCGAPGEACA